MTTYDSPTCQINAQLLKMTQEKRKPDWGKQRQHTDVDGVDVGRTERSHVGKTFVMYN